MAQTLQDGGIIPDVIKTAPSPDLGLIVSFKNSTLQMGAQLPRQETTTTEPHLKLLHPQTEESVSRSYTIIMTDPDLFKKNDPTGQVRHWVQTGLTASKSGILTNTTSEAAVTPYLSCAPGPGPAHRYAFILCEEPSDSTQYVANARKDFPTPSGTHDLKERMGFYAQDFIDKYGLTIVGATFMKVAPDAGALLDNVKLGAQAVAHKIVGK